MNVLIVEDNSAAAEMIESVVGAAGHKIVGLATDGKSALEMTADLRPDVVLMDIGLPDIDGIEVTGMIQRQCPTPVVVLSAFDDMEIVSRAGSAGAGAYVVKPPSPAELERAITIAVARFNDMTELARLNRKLESELAERQRAEEELRRERDFVQSLIDTAHTIVLVLDMQGRVVRFNRFMEQLSGWPLQEAKGKDYFETFLPAGEREWLRELFRKSLTEGPPKGKVVNPIIDRSGGEHIIEWYNEKLSDSRGSTMGILATGHDITEQERIEEERQRLEAQLHQAHKMESIGRLAGGIAHDFNNLLTPMIGYAEMALMDLNPSDPLYRDFQEIREAAERAKNLTSQLLAFSRRQILQAKIVNLNEVIASFETMLRRIIGEDIKVVTALEQNLGNVKADPAQIQQILMNLAINSRDAMPKGGTLEIKTSNVQIDDAHTRVRAGLTPGPHVMLAVSDTGAGMSKETLEKIFEPFFTTKPPREGTGLGLATVYGIVKQHGGHIWVYSEPGHGTAFKIYLPRTDDQLEAERTAEAQPVYKAGKGTVLVVEDESAVRKLACNILINHGYEVLEADDPEAALRIAGEHPGVIDLLLTDVVMPRMNGRELYNRVAALRPDVKVLYMSGYTDEIIAHHGMLDEQIDFLQKPFNVDLLVNKIHAMLFDSEFEE